MWSSFRFPTQIFARPRDVLPWSSRLQGDDLILCQITSRAAVDLYSVPLEEADFVEGSLRQVSNIRPNRIFTADRALVLYRAGAIRRRKLGEVVERIIERTRRG